MTVSPLGKFCHVISSGGRFAIWYYFWGNVCHTVYFPVGGGGLGGGGGRIPM